MSALGVLVFAAILLVLGGAGALGGRNMGGMMGDMDGESGRSGPPPSSGAPDVRVAAFEFGFEPREVKVRAGETVNLVLDNRGMMFHTLTLGRLGFDLRAEGGRSIGSSLKPAEPGRYEFICTVPGHANSGMRAVLVMEG